MPSSTRRPRILLRSSWQVVNIGEALRAHDTAAATPDANRRNLRTQIRRLIIRAGLAPWVKPWQNMRSTRETELVEQLGIKDASAIIGNTEKVALQHYVQLRPDLLSLRR